MSAVDDVVGTILLPIVQKFPTELARLGNVPTKCAFYAARRDEEEGVGSRKLAEMCVVENLSDFEDAGRRRECLAVLLALIIVPRPFMPLLAEIADDIAPQVAG